MNKNVLMLLALIFVTTGDGLYAMRRGFHRQGSLHDGKNRQYVRRSAPCVEYQGNSPVDSEQIVSDDTPKKSIRPGDFRKKCDRAVAREEKRRGLNSVAGDSADDDALREFLRRKLERNQLELAHRELLNNLLCEIDFLTSWTEYFAEHKDVLDYLIDRGLMVSWLNFSADCRCFFEYCSNVERILSASDPLVLQVDAKYGQLTGLFDSLDEAYGAWVEESYARHFPDQVQAFLGVVEE